MIATAERAVPVAAEHNPACTDLVFIGYPMRPDVTNERLEEGRGKLKYRGVTKRNFKPQPIVSSEYNRNFNKLWCQAFNEGLCSHWVLHHDDIVPELGAVDVMIEEMDRVGADVMSAVIALKDTRGKVTTGLRDPITGDSRLFNLREIHERLPETFNAEIAREQGFQVGRDDTLLVNTGLLVVNFKHWAIREFSAFQTRHEIRFRNGQMVTGEMTEDWNFSEWARRMGMRIFATRKVSVLHIGDWARDADFQKLLDEGGKPYRTVYPNDCIWGTECEP